MFLANMNGSSVVADATKKKKEEGAAKRDPKTKVQEALRLSLSLSLSKSGFCRARRMIWMWSQKSRCLSVSSSASGRRRGRTTMSMDSTSESVGGQSTSRSLGSSALGNAAIAQISGASRRERKNNREKQRRLEVNIMFDRLMKLLNLSKDSKSDKVKVLNQAIETIMSLRVEVDWLKQQMETQAHGKATSGEIPVPVCPAPAVPKSE